MLSDSSYQVDSIFHSKAVQDQVTAIPLSLSDIISSTKGALVVITV